MKMFGSPVYALVIWLLASASGCAFGNRKVDLTYPPKDYAEASVDHKLLNETKIRSIAVAVVDERPGDHSYLGEVRNGFYMHTADVVTDKDVATWVKSAFTKELQSAGFLIAKEKTADAILKVYVDLLHCNAYFSYSADIHLRLELLRAANVSTLTDAKGSGSAGMNWAATSESYGESLSQALADSFHQLHFDLSSGNASTVP